MILTDLVPGNIGGFVVCSVARRIRLVHVAICVTLNEIGLVIVIAFGG